MLSHTNRTEVTDQPVAALAGVSDDGIPIQELARDLLPVATAATPALDALAILDAHGGTRLVVLDEDETTYVGLVCLRGDRRRLCVGRDRFERRLAIRSP